MTLIFPTLIHQVGGNDSFTKLLLHFDGADASTTFTDVSAGGNHGNATVAGNAQVDTGQSVFGGASLQLDGTGDYLSFANHADWNLGGTGGGNDFTIDFRVRLASVASNTAFVTASDSGGTDGWAFYQNGGTELRIWNGPGTEQVKATTINTNTWYHIALVRASTAIILFQNGTLVGTFSDVDLNNDSNALYIGADTAGSSNNLNGWMDEIRISKGIARWTGAFTPPAQEYS